MRDDGHWRSKVSGQGSADVQSGKDKEVVFCEKN